MSCYETLATYKRLPEEVIEEEKTEAAQKFTCRALFVQSHFLRDGSNNWDGDPERLRKMLGYICDWLPCEVMEDALKPFKEFYEKEFDSPEAKRLKFFDAMALVGNHWLTLCWRGRNQTD